MAELFTLIHPDQLEEMKTMPAQPMAEQTAALVKNDPTALLPAEIRQKFREKRSMFEKVFGPDLPKYNEAFGRIKAVINLPKALPPSARLKEVPWYPKTLLVELQQKIQQT